MRLKDKIKVLTYLFGIFNLALMILGVFSVICGSWLLFNKSHLLSLLVSVDNFYPFLSFFANILMFEGVVLTVICFFGLILLIRAVKFVLVMYSGFLVLIFIMGCAHELLLLMYFHQGLVLNILIEKLQDIIFQYRKPGFPENEFGWTLVNAVQSKILYGHVWYHWKGHYLSNNTSLDLVRCTEVEIQAIKATNGPPLLNSFQLTLLDDASSCCGIYNYTDWLENKNQINPFNLPCSCSNSSKDGLFCELFYPAVFISGCEVKITTWYYNNILSMSALTVSLLLFEIVQFIVTLALIKSTHMLLKVSQEP